MSGSELRIDNPPIVEAVLDIDCDMPPGQKLVDMEQSAAALFFDQYPIPQKQYVQEYGIQTAAGTPASISTPSGVGIAALRFLQSDRKQLVQVRALGFSFNRLLPYTSLDNYLPEIDRRWHQYVSLASPIQVRLIRLRYINRILVPREGGRFDLDSYFRTSPRLPETEGIVLAGFVQQNSGVEVATGNKVNIVFASQTLEGDRLPVIFDIGVAREERGDPNDWGSILLQISGLRTLKNNVFRGSLTEKCLSLFRHS